MTKANQKKCNAFKNSWHFVKLVNSLIYRNVFSAFKGKICHLINLDKSEHYIVYTNVVNINCCGNYHSGAFMPLLVLKSTKVIITMIKFQY